MASNTVEPTKIIYVECMNFKPHDPHTWREGFLWHRKRECGGVPERECGGLWDFMKDIVIEPHRHYLGFCPEKSDQIYMIWRCMDPFCNAEYFKFRSLFNYQTGVREIGRDGYTVFYKKQKI